MAYNQVKSNDVNVEQLHSVNNYAVNVTAVELHVPPNNVMSNIRVDPQLCDFEWSAVNNLSEMNHSPDFWEIACCTIPFFLPSTIYNYCQRIQIAQSQKVKINDKHLYYEHINPAYCCCCFLNPITYQIRLEDIRFISFSVLSKNIIISYFTEINPSILPTTLKIKNFGSRSRTPELIMNIIEKNRPKKLQTKRYTIPYMSISQPDTTFTLNSATATIHFTDHYERKTSISFIDGLGDIMKYPSLRRIFNGKRHELSFWSPPVGRERSGSDDYPEMTAEFPDDDVVSTEFLKAAEASRDSFK
jgi:hypothetical protein